VAVVDLTEMNTQGPNAPNQRRSLEQDATTHLKVTHRPHS